MQYWPLWPSAAAAGLAAPAAQAWHPQPAIDKQVRSDTTGAAGDAVEASPGDLLTFPIAVRNAAPYDHNRNDLAGAVVTDFLPDGLEVLSLVQTDGRVLAPVSLADRQPSIHVGVLPEQQSRTVAVKARVRADITQPVTLVNKACLRGQDSGGEGQNFWVCDTATVHVKPRPVQPPVATPTPTPVPTVTPAPPPPAPKVLPRPVKKVVWTTKTATLKVKVFNYDPPGRIHLAAMKTDRHGSHVLTCPATAPRVGSITCRVRGPHIRWVKWSIDGQVRRRDHSAPYDWTIPSNRLARPGHRLYGDHWLGAKLQYRQRRVVTHYYCPDGKRATGPRSRCAPVA